MSEFYSVIQLLATIAIGFVLLGYSEFFTEMLRTRFFRTDEKISKAGKDCIDRLPDEATLNSLKATPVGKGTTEEQIKELKRKCKEMKENKIPEFEKQARKELNGICYLRSIASMSFFVFMFSTTMLFLPSLIRLYGAIVTIALLLFSSLCIVYMVLGWFLGEKEIKCKMLDFGSMMHPIVCFVLVCAISVGLAFLPCWESIDIGKSWKYLFVLLIIVGWVNFLMYAFVVRRTIKKFERLLNAKRQPYWDECNSLLDECNKLVAVMDVAKITDSSTATAPPADQK